MTHISATLSALERAQAHAVHLAIENHSKREFHLSNVYALAGLAQAEALERNNKLLEERNELLRRAVDSQIKAETATVAHQKEMLDIFVRDEMMNEELRKEDGK